jgi:hypothetical protein
MSDTDTNGQDLDAEEKRANDPEPRESEYHRGCLIVHWRGYVKDHEPTQNRRANGRTVIVYDDNQDEVTLRPTAFPLVPEPWASRCIKYAVGVPAPMCGGRAGRRFLTNGHWQCVVDEATFQGAIAQGFRDVGDHWSEPEVTRAMGLTFVDGVATTSCKRATLSRDRASTIEWRRGHPEPIYNVGGIWIRGLYLDLLHELGVTEVAGIDMLDGVNGMLRVVVPGVAVVMGIRDVVEHR